MLFSDLLVRFNVDKRASVCCTAVAWSSFFAETRYLVHVRFVFFVLVSALGKRLPRANIELCTAFFFRSEAAESVIYT